MSILPKAVTFLFLASGFAPNLLAQTLVVKDVDNESFKVFTHYHPIGGTDSFLLDGTYNTITQFPRQ